jgi:hypothetical protein
LFERGFQVFGDFLGENVGIGKAFISESEDIKFGVVAARLNALKTERPHFSGSRLVGRLGVAVMLSWRDVQGHFTFSFLRTH